MYRRADHQSNVPPGSVKLKADFISITPNNDASHNGSILIDEVIEYGHSTPPVSAGSRLLVLIPQSIYDSQKIEKEKSYLLVIKNIVEAQAGNTKQNWMIINIE